jgi:alanine racemase
VPACLGGTVLQRPTTATIDLDALAANYALAERLAGGRSVLAVVKADAYGHGAVGVAERLVASGCGTLAVVSVAEAVPLRDAGVGASILVLGGVHDLSEARAALQYRLTPVVHGPEHAALVASAAAGAPEPVSVQVELDTGMRRMGVAPESAGELLEQILTTRELHVEGLFTHLACADEVDLAASREQIQSFSRLLDLASALGIRPRWVHVSNSAALLAGKLLEQELPAAVNAVRPGLMLYGASPAAHLEADLTPVMTLRTRVVKLRDVHPSEGVGYGWTWRAKSSSRVATLPIGYEDGVPWSASNRAEVWLNGRRAPVVGRVSMDFITVDPGEGPVQIGDEVIVFGRGPQGTPSVEEAARAAGTIPYELLVRVGARVPRTLA